MRPAWAGGHRRVAATCLLAQPFDTQLPPHPAKIVRADRVSRRALSRVVLQRLKPSYNLLLSLRCFRRRARRLAAESGDWLVENVPVVVVQGLPQQGALVLRREAARLRGWAFGG